MRCLILSPFVPYPPEDGGRIRIYELLKGLASRHEIDILTLAVQTIESREAAEQLRAQGFGVQEIPHRPRPRLRTFARALRSRRSLYGTLFTSAAFAAELDSRLQAGDYDIVQCEFAYMAAYARAERRGARPRWILDAHNLEFRLNETLAPTARGLAGLAYRGYASRERRRRQAEELASCCRVDRVLTVSSVDRDVLRAALPRLKVDVVPNGVDLDHFTPSVRPEAGRSPSAVFVGKMDYRPNVDAVQWFCEQILPLVQSRVPGFTFTICGAHPSRAVLKLAKAPGVRVTGRVPDTRPYVDDAAVTVVPLRAGSGTRLKILEALAMGRPVVATTLGAEGLDLVDGEELVRADSASDFAERLVQLAARPGERERFGHAGRRRAEQGYGWPAIVDRLEGIYASLCADAVEAAR